MTIKLGNLADWRVLEAKALVFTAPDYDRDKPRRVRLDLNQEVGCNWYVKLGEEERFLASVPAGLQTVEFVCDGDFELLPVVPDGAEIQYWTSEAEEYWTEGDGETFSTIYERQPRNEALEYIMFQASQNQLRRDKAHAEELAAIRALVESNGQSGIHGEQASQHQKREPDERPGAEAGAVGAGVAGRRNTPNLEVAVGAGAAGDNPADADAKSGPAK